MMGTLAESLARVFMSEAGEQARRSRGNSTGSVNQQQQPSTLAALIATLMDLGKRAMYMSFKAVQYVLIFEALLLAATVLYGSLYWMVMPLRLHDRPLYFDYSDRGSMGGATATVDFLARHTQWDPSPLTRVDRLHGRVLRSGQQYEVGLELKMPTSYANRRAGVFMVRMTLLDDEDNVLATSARPAMLPHSSGLLKGVKMLFLWPLYLFGFSEEAVTLRLSCFDFFQESAKHPFTKARVVVSSGRVQFYHASINITPQLKGLPWLMHDWFYSTLAAGIMFITSLELMLIGFVYVFFFLSLGDGAPAGDGTARRTRPGNRSNNDGTARTGRTSHRANAQINSSASVGARPGGSSSLSLSGTSSHSPGGVHRSAATSTSKNVASTPEDVGLRRRPNAAGGKPGDASDSPHDRPPPGVQSYQSAAHYVVPGSGEIAGSDASGVVRGGAVVGVAEGSASSAKVRGDS